MLFFFYFSSFNSNNGLYFKCPPFKLKNSLLFQYSPFKKKMFPFGIRFFYNFPSFKSKNCLLLKFYLSRHGQYISNTFSSVWIKKFVISKMFLLSTQKIVHVSNFSHFKPENCLLLKSIPFQSENFFTFFPPFMSKNGLLYKFSPF